MDGTEAAELIKSNHIIVEQQWPPDGHSKESNFKVSIVTERIDLFLIYVVDADSDSPETRQITFQSFDFGL